jgi:AcrR family transcriptional regulator
MTAADKAVLAGGGADGSSVTRAPRGRRKAQPVNGRPSRRLTRAGSDTREKILDAAEKLFAEHGYYGASLRDVSEAADVHLALSTYHFGTKEQLFNDVVSRRAAQMRVLRMGLLQQLDATKGSRSETVRGLIYAYVTPLVEARYSTSQHWRNYVQMMAGIVNVRQWTPLIKKYYDEVSYEFIRRFREQLPNARENALLDAMSFMIGAMMAVCAQTERFARDKETKSQPRTRQMERVLDDLVSYCHGGFMLLCDEPARASRKPKTPRI